MQFFFSLATGDKDLHHMDGLGCFCVNILVEICIKKILIIYISTQIKI